MATDESWGPSLCEPSVPRPSEATAASADGTPTVSHLQRELRAMHAKMREQTLFIALQEKQMEVIQRENNELRQTSLRSGSDLAKSTAKNSELQRALNTHIQAAEKRESHLKRLKAHVMDLEMAFAEAQQELETLRQRRGAQKQERRSSGGNAQITNAQKGKKGQERKKERERAQEPKVEKGKATNGQKKKAEDSERVAGDSRGITGDSGRVPVASSQPSKQKKAKKTQRKAEIATKNTTNAKNSTEGDLRRSQATVATSHEPLPTKGSAKAAKKEKQKRKKESNAGKQQEEPIDGVAGFMVNMLTPGVQSDAISVLNWVFGLLFLSIVLMIMYGKASFHFGVFGLLALGLFGSVQYYLAEAAKLDGVLNPTEEQLKKEAEAITALKAKREQEKTQKQKK